MHFEAQSKGKRGIPTSWKDLSQSGRYSFKYYDHSAPDRTVTGRELMTRGLQVTLPLTNSSELIFIEGSSTLGEMRRLLRKK